MKTPDFYEEAKTYVKEQGFCNSFDIQRKFNIGFNLTGQIVDLMVEEGLIEEFNGNRNRKLLRNEKA